MKKTINLIRHMTNNLDPQPKNSQFAINVHNYLNNTVSSIASAFAKSFPENVGVFRIGYNAQDTGELIKGSLSRFIRSDTEEELFKVGVCPKGKPYLLIKP